MIVAEKDSKTGILLPSSAWALCATGIFWFVHALTEAWVLNIGSIWTQLFLPSTDTLYTSTTVGAIAFLVSFALHKQLFRSTNHFKNLLSQQQRLNTLIKKSTDITLIVDENGICTYVSPSITEILGYEVDEIINKAINLIVLPKHLTRTEKLFQRAIHEQSVALPIALQLINKWGDVRHVEGSIANMLKVPLIEGLVINLRDVTSKVDAEEARDQMQSKYQNLFLKNEVAIWEEDYSGVYRELQRLREIGIENITDYLERNEDQAKRLAGMVRVNEFNQATLILFNATSRNDFIWHIKDISSKQSLGLFKEQVQAIWKKQKLFQTDATYKTLDGNEIHVHLSMPIPDHEAGFRHIPISRQNITDRKNSEQALRRSQNQLAEAQRLAKLGSWEWNIANNNITCSREAYRILGYDIPPSKIHRDEFIGRVHPEDREQLKGIVFGTTEHLGTIELDYRILTPEGHCHIVKVIGESLFDEDGNTSHMMGTLQDITKQRQNEERMMLANRMFEHTNEGIFITDQHSKIITVNKAFTTITGYLPEEVSGHTPKILQSGKHNADFYHSMWEEIRTKGCWQGEIWNRTKQGRTYPEWLMISEVKDDHKDTINYIGTFSDISKIKRSEKKLEYLAYHDPLTKLPNRLKLKAQLDITLRHASRHQQQVVLFLIDLDLFKHVNDSLGHNVGDDLLVEVANRLKLHIRSNDILARWGGDEFIVVMNHTESFNNINDIASKLLTTLKLPFNISQQDLFLGASIGISLFPQDGDDITSLIKNADTAMYKAKEKGRDCYEYYSPALGEAAMDRIKLEAELRRAIEQEELVVYYQPQFDMRDGTLLGAEALVRWQHPVDGLVSPIKFIPLAEETGLIVQLGEYVLAKACSQLVAWKRKGFDLPTISVNIAGRQIGQSDLVERVTQILLETNCPAHQLELEVTENFIMESVEDAIDVLSRLRKLNIKLAIDDFGTGYSSLSYLKRLPVDKLKIDKSFILETPDDNEASAITEAVLTLGQALKLKVVAEGIETPSQQKFLGDLGCDIAQGFLYGRPEPAKDFERHFREVIDQRSFTY